MYNSKNLSCFYPVNICLIVSMIELNQGLTLVIHPVKIGLKSDYKCSKFSYC